MKIQVKSIYLNKVEGKIHDKTIFPETFNSSEVAWHYANSKLIRWAKEMKVYPINSDCYGCYDKVDFKITWKDNEEYEGRYDLHAQEHANIGKQVKRFLEYLIKTGKDIEVVNGIKNFMETHEIYI